MIGTALLLAVVVAPAPAAVPAAPAQPAASSQGPDTSETDGVGSQPASPTEILDAVGDCVAAVQQHGKVDYDKLKAAGWKYGGQESRPIKAANGPTLTMTHLYFGKGNVIQVLQVTGISAACQTIGWFPETPDAEATMRNGIAERFKAVAAADYKGDELMKLGIERLTPGTLKKMMINDTNRFAVMSVAKNGRSQIIIQMTPKITK